MAHWKDFLDANAPDGAYLPWKKVEPRVGISRTTAWRLQKAGDFPEPYVVSAGRVAYREAEVEAWKASRGHRTIQPRLSCIEARLAAVPSRTAKPEASSWAAPPQRQDATAEEGTPSSRASLHATRSARRSRQRRQANSDQIAFEF